jgi:hypothetical protein
LGRDFLCGFFGWAGESPLIGILEDIFSSKLRRPDRLLWLLFPSESAGGGLFFLPSLGDFALVVGICIKVTTSRPMQFHLDSPAGYIKNKITKRPKQPNRRQKLSNNIVWIQW